MASSARFVGLVLVLCSLLSVVSCQERLRRARKDDDLPKLPWRGKSDGSVNREVLPQPAQAVLVD